VEVIPAIDLKNGKCVRLLQGKDDSATQYSDDPVATARDWVVQGARRLHIVNLDGAFGRTSGNFEIVSRIVSEADAIIEFGGGIRSMESVEQAFNAGVHKIVLGTSAIENRDLVSEVLLRFGTERIIVSLDAVEGKVATRGWQTVSDINVVDAAKQMQGLGVSEILYTDIQRDGMLAGPDFETLALLASTGLHVIASGGVSSNADVVKLLELGSPNIVGVIIGKALYERRILLPDLLEVLRQLSERV